MKTGDDYSTACANLLIQTSKFVNKEKVNAALGGDVCGKVELQHQLEQQKVKNQLETEPLTPLAIFGKNEIEKLERREKSAISMKHDKSQKSIKTSKANGVTGKVNAKKEVTKFDEDKSQKKITSPPKNNVPEKVIKEEVAAQKKPAQAPKQSSKREDSLSSSDESLKQLMEDLPLFKSAPC